MKGKLLYMRCEKGRGIYFTLGMTGSFGWERSANSRVGLDFDVNQTEKRTVYFNDQRNFGTVTFCLQNKTLLDKLNKIGVSFLDGLSAEQFHNLVERQKKTKSSRSLAVFLMDQTRTSGVGNYILSESLYRSRLSPWVSVGELSRGQVTELYFHIRDIMEMSYEAQREFPFARGTIHQYLQVQPSKEAHTHTQNPLKKVYLTHIPFLLSFCPLTGVRPKTRSMGSNSHSRRRSTQKIHLVRSTAPAEAAVLTAL